MDIIKAIEHEQLKNKIPDLKIGDTVKVHVKVKEGNRERIQVFEGIIIKKQGGGVNATFTVRRISYGVGVEKTFMVHSPTVEKVEVVRVGKVRRAKLFYLRDRIGKAAKTKEKTGARIQTGEITIKEEVIEEGELIVPETEAEVVSEEIMQEAVEAQAAEEKKAAETEVSEESVETNSVSKEATKEPVKADIANNLDAPAEAPEEAPEEAPAVETKTPVVEEVVDTVKEEPITVVEEEPVETNLETAEDKKEK